jgi:hypothetical protein
MPASTGSPIKTQVKKIDGLSVRYAESEPRDVPAILLSPWPESRALCGDPEHPNLNPDLNRRSRISPHHEPSRARSPSYGELHPPHRKECTT